MQMLSNFLDWKGESNTVEPIPAQPNSVQPNFTHPIPSTPKEAQFNPCQLANRNTSKPLSPLKHKRLVQLTIAVSLVPIVMTVAVSITN